MVDSQNRVFEVKLAYRTLLVQIVFKNYKYFTQLKTISIFNYILVSRYYI